MKLLIADDQTSLHTFLDKTMDWNELGFTEILHAYDGEEALRTTEERCPEVVIMDIHMPYMNGIEAVSRIRKAHIACKILILSAYDEFEYARQALRWSVSQYVLKPVDMDALQAVLRETVADIRAEILQSLEHHLDKMIRLQSCSQHDEQTIQKMMNLLGVRWYGVLTIHGEADYARRLTASLLKRNPAWVPFLYEKKPGNHVCIIGITSNTNDAEVYELMCIGVSACDGAGDEKASIGWSGSSNELSPLMELLRNSEQGALRGFYDKQPVHACRENTFSAQWSHHQSRKIEHMLLEIASSTRARDAAVPLQNVIHEAFQMFRSLWIDPELVYAAILQFLITIQEVLEPSEPLGSGSVQMDETDRLSSQSLQRFRTAEQLESYIGSRIEGWCSHRPSAGSYTEHLLGSIKHYVDLNCGTDVSLQTVAERFSMDKYQLSRGFKRFFGINYWSYVTCIRMEKAAELLLKTEMKNSEVAVLTGYGDESHFSRAFKKHYHVSPKEYRTAQKADKGPCNN
jgi:YesN/AraC family two-component response regulator